MKKFDVHQLKIEFQVTEQIKRYVYVYIIEAEHLYMIDSGVYGCEKQIEQYLKQIGRDISDIKAIFLTHAHPDHIGSASWFQKNIGCKIYASDGERRWIEDIDLQYKERPIPNFYNLAGKSAIVDTVVKDGDKIELEDGLRIEAISTVGHSIDGMSYKIQRSLFIGDAVPVSGDIPIFIDECGTRRTLEHLEKTDGIDFYYPAWDYSYTRNVMLNKIAGAKRIVDTLKQAVTELDDSLELSMLVDSVCERLKMPMLKANPLFARTISCLREERQS
ncbi:MAG: MBL fold metallo-hydrolase [Ruminococcus sp.]